MSCFIDVTIFIISCTATVKCVPNFALCLFSVVEVMAGGDTLTVDPNQMWDKHVSFTNL